MIIQKESQGGLLYILQFKKNNVFFYDSIVS